MPQGGGDVANMELHSRFMLRRFEIELEAFEGFDVPLGSFQRRQVGYVTVGEENAGF